MKFISTLSFTLISLLSFSQYQEIIVVEIDNKSLVPGNTYQFYAQFANENDHVHIIFGDDIKELVIQSTEKFYQNEFGGAMSSNINPKLDSLDKTVRYDSYLSIGRTNSHENYLSNFNLDLNQFESDGSGIRTDDGAWYVTPDQDQAYCKNGNKHVLMAQLTTNGIITGQISMQGKDNKGSIWRELAIPISSENALSEKDFMKLRKANEKKFKKTGL